METDQEKLIRTLKEIGLWHEVELKTIVMLRNLMVYGPGEGDDITYWSIYFDKDGNLIK